MKRAAMTVALLAIAGWSGANYGWTQSSKSAGQATTSASGQVNAAAAPAGKRPPQAKTQPEFDAYKSAAAISDPTQQEKAAADFAAKYPDSELRPVLYKAAMHAYQGANNADKMLEMAQKVLTYDGDDPEALLGVSQVVAERTRETDLDRDQRLDEAKKDAEKALSTIDTDLPTSGYPPDQLKAYKDFLRSEAYAILGTIYFSKKDWTDAETNLRKSIDAYPQQPDSVAVFRLSVSLDMQNKYPEAMKFANQAVDLTKEGTAVGDAARKEKERLTQLTGGAAPASAK